MFWLYGFGDRGWRRKCGSLLCPVLSAPANKGSQMVPSGLLRPMLISRCHMPQAQERDIGVPPVKAFIWHCCSTWRRVWSSLLWVVVNQKRVADRRQEGYRRVESYWVPSRNIMNLGLVTELHRGSSQREGPVMACWVCCSVVGAPL